MTFQRPALAPPETCGVITAMASTERVAAILDSGASRCVIGNKLLEQFVQQLPSSIRAQVRESPSAVKFRFGNNFTLTSTKRVYLPLQATCGKLLWMGLKVVPGRTPFLLSQRVLKQLNGNVCTCSDTCCLESLGVQIQLSTNASGLYLIDMAKLCTGKMMPATPKPQTSLAYLHEIQRVTESTNIGTSKAYVGDSSVEMVSRRTPEPCVNDAKLDPVSSTICPVSSSKPLPRSRVRMSRREASRSSSRFRTPNSFPGPDHHAGPRITQLWFRSSSRPPRPSFRCLPR